MGGFHLYRLPAGASHTPYPAKSAFTTFVLPLPGHSREDEEAKHPLGLEDLKDLSVEVLAYIIPTETEIKDRGKADPIGKTLVLFQTVWFVMQCIARGVAYLPLTELEILTIAYAAMSLFIYYFWWDKPKDVECPIRVYKTATGEPVTNGEKAEWGRGIRGMYNRMFYIPGEQDIFFRLTEERQVPIFWSGKPGESVRWSVSLWASLLGAAFGAVHFIAWNSVFPTHIELLLWRISCIAMTAIPLLVSAESIISMIGGYNSIIVTNALLFATPFAALAVLLYIFARMAILVIAFTTLRSLQSDGLRTVEWTSFLPHI